MVNGMDNKVLFDNLIKRVKIIVCHNLGDFVTKTEVRE